MVINLEKRITCSETFKLFTVMKTDQNSEKNAEPMSVLVTVVKV